MVNWRKYTVTVGGSGLSPVAPGTAGSLATAAVLWGIYAVFKPVGWVWLVILGVGLLKSSALCVWLGDWAAGFFGRKDPGPMVLDEAAGICLTLMFLPMRGWGGAISIGAAFLAFRLFDVTKPAPARQLERLPGGWGILLDDLAAAVYANLLCQIFLRWAI